MHGFDTSIPHFFSRVCGMHIVVTPICMHSITDPRAWFLLSLLEGIFIDFPSHFILSLIDVYRDSTTRDKLIFPLAITRILHHFSISFPKSPHFTVMSAIDAATVRWSKAQLKAASNKDDDSSSFYRSIHLHFFVFCEWSDSWGHHGTACAHGCFPWHTQWWVVSGEHPCWLYRMTTSYHGWFHCYFFSISTGF